MSKLAPLTNTQSTRVERINDYHRNCLSSFNTQISYAFLAGVELLALKEDCRHGDFVTIREKHLPDVPYSSATRYMKFADLIGQKTHTVGFLKPERLRLLTNGELSDEQKAKILEAVYDLADGKTLTELYRDLGVIRPPKKPGGNKPKAEQRRMTSEERDAEAHQVWSELFASMELQKDKIARLNDDDRDRGADLCIELGKLFQRKKVPRGTKKGAKK
jgi:hypothetical protein